MEMAKSGRLVVDQGLVLYAPQVTLYCLDYLTGALRWKVPTGLAYGSPNMFLYADCVLLAASGEFACFNAQTGAQLWHEKSTSKGALLAGNAMAAPGVAVQIDRSS
jgi:outer membrane protein assembly factor BamB